VQDGDVVSLDCGAVVGGMYSDHAVTAIAGSASPEKQALIDVTTEALKAAIGAVRPDNRIGDVSNAIETHVLPRGYQLVREYVGHGIGRSLHEPPSVPNFGQAGRGPKLRPGMVLAVEPMVNIGGWETKVLDDGWTVVTADGSLSAHFEHTIAVTGEGPEVLTTLPGA
jgi:methionyl aminopeptidase